MWKLFTTLHKKLCVFVLNYSRSNIFLHIGTLFYELKNTTSSILFQSEKLQIDVLCRCLILTENREQFREGISLHSKVSYSSITLGVTANFIKLQLKSFLVCLQILMNMKGLIFRYLFPSLS